MIASALAPAIASGVAGCHASGGAATGTSPPPADDAGDGAACSSTAVSLVVTTRSTAMGSEPTHLYVPVEYRGSPAVFLLDTGSPYTFLHEPLPDGGPSPFVTPRAGAVSFGCEDLVLDGRQVVDEPPVEGKPVVGTLGDDRLLAQSIKLDLEAGRVAWDDSDAPFPETSDWPSTSYDRPRGYVRLQDVSLDGTPVELVLDTGSPNALWLGQDGKPGDTQVDGEDSAGNTVKMYLGEVVVTVGDFKETVPVYRVPSFPYMQPFVNQLGGHVNGLFGLSAFHHGVAIDTRAGRVRVAP